MEQFIKEASDLIGRKLSDSQINAFRIYEQELLEWNEKINLTAIRENTQIRRKHFLDSLTCLQVFADKRPTRIIDIGSGAGFPGIPLKIILPEMKLTLVESIGKKVRFCQHVAEQLKMENINIIQGRAEDLGQSNDHRERYDWAVARAVAGLPILVEYLLPFVRLGGGVIAQKGENAPAEVQQSQHAIHILGGNLRQIIPVTIPGVADGRFLVVIDKVAATPKMYPRNTGIPAKKPLI